MPTKSPRWRVLISAKVIQRNFERLKPFFDEHDIDVVMPPPISVKMTEDELYQWTGDVDATVSGDDYFTERVLRHAKRLKVISKWGTGTDSINHAVCRELGIKVFNTPGAFTIPVADSVLAYILAHARRLQELDAKMRAGVWDRYPSYTLAERVLGIVGLGRIGKAIVTRARTFDMTILGCDPGPVDTQFIRKHKVKMVSKEELFTRADYISLNCDLNPTSRHLVSTAELARVKPTAYLINTARGGVVDEAALVLALQQQRLAGAALDVFSVEPLAMDSPLRQITTVLLAPHHANASVAAHEHVHQNTLKNLIVGLRQSTAREQDRKKRRG